MSPPHWLILAPGSAAQRIVPVGQRLVVGRECVGVTPEQRLVVDDASVSRDHLELRVDRDGEATLTDRSTNGTRVNGVRLSRRVPAALRDGDRIELGAVTLAYRSPEWSQANEAALRSTIRDLEAGGLTIVPDDPLATLTAREREILALIAQGHSNGAIADRLVLSLRTVEAHVRSIMLELRLPEAPDDNRRVHAVLTYLRAITVAEQARAS